jgi:oligoendopeptidase F
LYGNARKDQAKAVDDYRKALALGGTATLPELFSAAGVRFAFDAETLGTAVALVEATIEELSTV